MRISEGGVSRQRARHVQMPWGKIVPAVVQGAVNKLGGRGRGAGRREPDGAGSYGHWEAQMRRQRVVTKVRNGEEHRAAH